MRDCVQMEKFLARRKWCDVKGWCHHISLSCITKWKPFSHEIVAELIIICSVIQFPYRVKLRTKFLVSEIEKMLAARLLKLPAVGILKTFFLSGA
jgi:hypothetical protein